MVGTYQMSLSKIEGSHKIFPKKFLEKIVRADMFYFILFSITVDI